MRWISNFRLNRFILIYKIKEKFHCLHFECRTSANLWNMKTNGYYGISDQFEMSNTGCVNVLDEFKYLHTHSQPHESSKLHRNRSIVSNHRINECLKNCESSFNTNECVKQHWFSESQWKREKKTKWQWREKEKQKHTHTYG